MKIHIDIVNGLAEDEVLIRCGKVDDTIRRIHEYILEQASLSSKVTFYKENQEFYFPLDEVLFFETEGEHIYAHTANDAYRIRYRLYELETLLPGSFVRAAKSTIVNTEQVYSVTRSLTSSSLVQFFNSHKQVYVSRYYYREFRRRLNERSHYEK
ncbi:MAG: LytTR family transcriptional regulator [Clostridiales bacterium]|nr:LytTR family transcriptional regulator [Clostridiales bacterium]